MVSSFFTFFFFFSIFFFQFQFLLYYQDMTDFLSFFFQNFYVYLQLQWPVNLDISETMTEAIFLLF